MPNLLLMIRTEQQKVNLILKKKIKIVTANLYELNLKELNLGFNLFSSCFNRYKLIMMK